MATDPYRYFRVEARELLGQLTEGVLALERGSSDEDLVPRLLRDAHTLKGAARVVRLPALADEVHRLEDLLAAVRQRGLPAEAAALQAMLAILDRVEADLAALETPPRAAPEEAGEAAAATTRHDDASYLFRADVDDIEAVAQGLASVEAELRRLDDTTHGLDELRRLAEVVDDQLAVQSTAVRADGGEGRHEGLRALTGDVRRRLGSLERDCLHAVERASREVRHAADATARLRLAPARSMFRFLERATRDAAQAEHKRVRFHADGTDIRLEPEMLSVLQSALLHLVRNAVVHGVEADTRLREQAGKPAEATVRITVERVRQHVRFTCEDDGSGIDVPGVRDALVRKGVHVPDTADATALWPLLLAGGVTTAATVTPLAGRGVGLGVVREAAARLGGRVDVSTTPGQGTTVEVIVPFALASMPAILVEAADVAAALPLDAVASTLTIDMRQLAPTPQQTLLAVDGRSLPVIALHRVLAPDAEVPSIAGRPALVVRRDGRAAVVVVDRILRAATITVRPLPALAPASAAVAGASVDPGGRPRLVIDPQALVSGASAEDVVPEVPRTHPTSILVVDDSLTTRMLEQSILEAAGYRVGLASSGLEGLERARKGDYALCLVDVEMPDIDGFTFVERVRADPLLARTPIILVTSRSAPEDRERGLAAGANAYIVKSAFDQHELLRQIRSLIQA